MSFFSSSGLDTIALAAAQLESQKCQDASEKFFKERKPADSKAKSIKEESVVNDDVSSSSNPDIVITINENDVLCGRGGETNHHPGNIQYRRLVKIHQRAYLEAKRRDKPRIAKIIVDQIRNQNPSGRFLKKINCRDKLMWQDVGNVKAREKTSQALREGAPEIRDRFDSKSNSNHIENRASGSPDLNSNTSTILDSQVTNPNIELASRADGFLGPRQVSETASEAHARLYSQADVISCYEKYDNDINQVKRNSFKSELFNFVKKRKRPINIQDNRVPIYPQLDQQSHAAHVNNIHQQDRSHVQSRIIANLPNPLYDTNKKNSANQKVVSRGPRLKLIKARMRMETQKHEIPHHYHRSPTAVDFMMH